MSAHHRRLAFGYVIGAALAVLSGCRTAPSGGGGMLFFPAPPDPPRVQFLTWATGSQEVEPARGAFADFVVGEQTTARKIDKPYGLAARDGVVYVCDTKGLALCRLDFKNKTYSVIGVQGPGRLRKPINVVIDDLGYKFVADTVRKQIVVFGPDDRYVTAHDIPEPCRPVDVAVYQNELYVLDNDETPRILVLDRTTGKVLRSVGSAGGEPGQFRIPNSLAVGSDGSLYVTDTHNFRIEKLTPEGQCMWAVGVPGYRLGQFGRPRGIRVGPDNTVFVVDGATELVQMFDSAGETLMRFGGPGDIPGALVLPSQIAVDKTSIPYFKQYAHKDFRIDYLVFVASQYGPRLLNVYAFGSFPPGYHLSESEIKTLPPLAPREPEAPGQGERENDQPPAASAPAGAAQVPASHPAIGR
jgi:sugar lactone lactonase YvrE